MNHQKSKAHRNQIFPEVYYFLKYILVHFFLFNKNYLSVTLDGGDIFQAWGKVSLKLKLV